MLKPRFASLNKQRAEYRPVWVFGTRGGWDHQKFARPAGRADRPGRLIGGSMAGVDVVRAGCVWLALTIKENQALSGADLGQVAAMPSQRSARSAVFCVFEASSRLIASFATVALDILGELARIDLAGQNRGGGFPLSPPPPPPYAGRAGQTCLWQKPGPAPAIDLGRECAVVWGVRKIGPLAIGSGVAKRVVQRISGSAGSAEARNGSGLCLRHILLDRGQVRKFAGGRG
jgi:hypothetical protein